MESSPPDLPAVLQSHAIAIPEAQVRVLDRYCRLLWDWNTKINLTRHTDFEKFVSRDLVDTLAFAEFLEPGERVLDVGSGGGVPGLVLAILRPDLKITLADSVGKKARVLKDLAEKLGLPVPVHAGRAESLLEKEGFDSLTIRAVARLAKLLEWFAPYWGRFGRMLVLKGPAWVEERGEARHLGRLKALALRRLKSYPIPESENESVLLQICRKSALTRWPHGSDL